MKKSFLVLGISILVIIFLVNLILFDTFDIVSSDDVSQIADNIPQQNTNKSEHDETIPEQFIETIANSDDIITLFNTLPDIQNSFAVNESDMIIGQRLNVTDFKVTTLTWKFEKGGEPAEGTIMAQILINADIGSDTVTIVANADKVLVMQDMSPYLKEYIFTFSGSPILTGEVVFALNFDYTSEPYCCAISRSLLFDDSAEGKSTTKNPNRLWVNSNSDEGVKIEGIQVK